MTSTTVPNRSLEERLHFIRARMELAAERSRRSLDDVILIAVSKTHPLEAVLEASKFGLTDFGENRVQEAEPKISAASGNNLRWHLIGHLQANKARRAVRLFDVIHSLDTLVLAQRLDRMCAEEGRKELSVLVQVDLGKEKTKSGVLETELGELIKEMARCSHLRLSGLMLLPPFLPDPENVRPYFRRLRELRDLYARSFANGKGELSMGMTQDFEIAIEEGATMLRVGTAIFGERRVSRES